MPDFTRLELIGRGATTKIYRDGDRAYKLYEDAPEGEAENEFIRHRFAWSAGLPVPEIYAVHQINEHLTAVEMACIDGEVLLHPDMDPGLFGSALETLVSLQRKIHQTSAEGFPLQSDRLAMRISFACCRWWQVPDSRKSRPKRNMRNFCAWHESCRFETKVR